MKSRKLAALNEGLDTRDNHAAFACRHRLIRVEAENCRGGGAAPDVNTIYCSWHRMRGIVNDRNSKGLGQLIDATHVAREPAEVNRHNGPRSRRNRCGNFIGIYAKRLRIDIDKHCIGTES